MTSPLQKTGFRDSRYERPTQKWVCGRTAAGTPCPVGPDRRGRCTEPLENRCRPRLGWRARRSRLAISCTALSVGVVVLLVVGPQSPALLSPGHLSSSHATIVSMPEPAGGCGACHAAAAAGPVGWLAAATGSGPEPVQNQRCLQCHFSSDPDAAVESIFAHGVSPDRLTHDFTGEGTFPPAASSAAPGSGILHAIASLAGDPIDRPADPVRCAACHREHRGAGHDLAHLDDLRCQACHQQSMRRFDSGHPEFGPVRRARRGIRFDHRDHEQTQFGDTPFTCDRCHRSSDGGRIELRGYAESCTGCHHQGKEDWHTARITGEVETVFQLPEFEFLDESAGYPMAAARGEELTLMMRLLLLGGDDDLLDPLEGVATEGWAPVWWEPEEEEQTDRLAGAIMGLAEGTATADGFGGLLEQALGPGTERAATRLQGELRSAGSALDIWRRRLRTGASGEWTPPAGLERWSLDTAAAAIVYRPGGHSDPFLLRWINALAAANREAGPGDRDRLRARIVDEALSPGGGVLYTACLRCHQVESRPAINPVNWTGAGAGILTRGYARFDHRSHAALFPGEEGCRRCHTVGGEAEAEHAVNRGFTPHRVSQCAACHTPSGAPDDCLTCHQYHFRRP